MVKSLSNLCKNNPKISQNPNPTRVIISDSRLSGRFTSAIQTESPRIRMALMQRLFACKRRGQMMDQLYCELQGILKQTENFVKEIPFPITIQLQEKTWGQKNDLKMFFKVKNFDLGLIGWFIVCERYLRRDVLFEQPFPPNHHRQAYHEQFHEFCQGRLRRPSRWLSPRSPPKRPLP